jgi:type I restriction enzyme M protein
MTFTESKKEFDSKYGSTLILPKSLVPINGEYKGDISLKNKKGEPSEEYYKWQFIYSLIDSGLYSKDFIGVEISFPKGNKNAAPIKIDGCIFDDKDWIDYYHAWINDKDDDAVEWLREHLIAVIEFKKDGEKDIKKIFTSQVKAYLKESERDYSIGFYYDTERLHIFQKKNGKILRYDDSKNQKGAESSVGDLSLDLPDGYIFIPSFEEVINKINKPKAIDRSKRTIDDLDLITGVHSTQISLAISNILKKMDKVGLVNQRGYEILIQMLALKIFDEKRSEKYKEYLKFYSTEKEQEKLNLLFYITNKEKEFRGLNDENIQSFIKRMRTLYNDASLEYKILLKPIDTETINWKNEGHIQAVSGIVENLQDYSFLRSQKHHKNDLYQLVFYKFANASTKAEKGQFITPLILIDFLVKIVNPKDDETVVDPTVGIADFLSLSYVNSNGRLDDSNLYGVDNDEQMIMLAKLNMLLNGDGNAVLKYQPDKGSLLYKFNTEKKLVPLDVKLHKKGNWDNWFDQTKLMKFDVVLTNPPFGEDRKYEPKTENEKEIAELYELWDTARTGNWIDMGLLFLENAYRILDTNGRMGIVVSNSIASIERWEVAREWLIDKMRLVAFFDLPPNVFADTGVNTTLIVAYKPEKKELERLKKSNYEVFIRDIKNMGYEIRTLRRVKYYNPIYKFDEKTFEITIDDKGMPKLDEDFSNTLQEFKQWINRQEDTLKKLFGN